MEEKSVIQGTKTSFFLSVVRGVTNGKKIAVVTDVHEATDVFTHKTFECWVSKYLMESYSDAKFSDPEVWKLSNETEAKKQKEEIIELCKKEGREVMESGILERTSC
ncbi:MAG: hypothetical protein AAF363_12675 [Bacteroidota bacterium]